MIEGDMAASEPRPVKKRSEARERLLATASQLFYAEGINSVGVERIIKEAQVTLATLYRHFPSKVDLAVAYLQGAHDHIVARAIEQADKLQDSDLVRAIGEDVTSQIRQAAFRGCAFLNAASEFEDPQSPVRQVVAEHRQWYYQLIHQAFDDAGHQLPANAARHFVMLRDGAMSAAYLDTPTIATRTFTRGVDGLIRTIDTIP
jgi:AcrR family transcriptional regulator